MKRRRLTDEERPRIAVGYIRVSTSGQALDGVSLDAQRARIEAWCTGNGYTRAALHTDAGLSGSRADNRPGLQAALADATKDRAALVVYSLSRLARSTRDAIAISDRLDRAGADLVSLSEKIDTSSAGGRFFFRLMAAVHELERDQIAERTAMAMQHKRSKGEFTGGHAPFGWRVGDGGVLLEPDPDEQATMVRAAALRAEGWSLRAIGRRLDAEGRPARGGKPWAAKVLRDVLESAPRRATEAA